MIEETNLKPNEVLKCEESDQFQIYYLSRQESHGGGLALGVDRDLESTLMRAGNDEVEVMSIQECLGDIPVRIILGYGPQENALLEKKNKFWEIIENEINEAELEGH